MTQTGRAASYSVRVFGAEDLRAVAGVNQGDPLGTPGDLCAGDTYRLRPAAAAMALAIADSGLAQGAPGGAPVLGTSAEDARVAPESEAGEAGSAVHLVARLTFLAPDGHSVDLIVLRAGLEVDCLLVFPLGPLEAGLDYVLAGIGPAGEVRLADVAPFAFAAGTRITMADGTQRAVEALHVGDVVLTRDGGPLPLRRVLVQTQRALGPNAPVVIPADTLGNPGDLVLSQHQRLLVYQRGPDRLTETAEMLIRAGDLVDEARIFLRRGGFVDYVTLVLDTHEMLYAECVAVESLEVGPATRHRLAEDHARAVEGLAHSPHYGSEAGRSVAAAARKRLLSSGS